MKTEAKTHRFRFRVSEDEAEQIKKISNDRGYPTISHFLRDIVLRELEE